MRAASGLLSFAATLLVIVALRERAVYFKDTRFTFDKSPGYYTAFIVMYAIIAMASGAALVSYQRDNSLKNSQQMKNEPNYGANFGK